MKKFLVVLLALVVVGGAFAQTAAPAPALTFGLYGDITATLATADSYAIYTETYLTYAAKDMGLNATVVSGADIFATPRNFKIWYQVCSAAKVSVGTLREAGSARLTSYIDGNGFSTRMANVETGVLNEMKILPGVLTASVFIPVTSLAPASDFANSSLGLSFTLPNVATVVAAYRFNGKEASIGVDLKALKDLTVRVGLMNQGAFGATTVLYYTAGRNVSGLNLGVDGFFYLKPAPKYGFEVRAEYTLGSYVLGGKVNSDNYATAGWYKNNATIVKGYLKRNFAAGDAILGVQYNVTSAAFSLPVDFEISF